MAIRHRKRVIEAPGRIEAHSAVNLSSTVEERRFRAT